MACIASRRPLDRLSFLRALLVAGCLVLVPSFVLAQPAAPAIAQSAASIAGFVVDASGGALPGARIVVRDATGAAVFATVADNLGAFALPRLAAGQYMVHVEAALFQPATQRFDVTGTTSASALRIALTPLGFSEHLVVTGRRTEARLAETPQKIDVIDAADLERSVAADITDALKKNAGVDVVQYSGVLSGIGIRGFRPETSGINKRSLLLVNGRPSGVTNLGMLRLDNIDRIEVLKGPASSVYGASAMGGVVNVITKPSHKNLAGTANVGFGSFRTSDLGGSLGGAVGSHVDFDVTGNMYDQRDDFRMGDGVVRPATTYKTYDGTVRVGADLSSTWRIDGTANGYRGRDIMTPGDVFTGTTSQGSKDLERSAQDVRLAGTVGTHAMSATAYRTAEAGHTSNVATTSPLDQPFLPYLTFENEFGWRGVQLRDAWQWRGTSSLVFGLDYEHVESVSRSYARTGAPQAPFSADNLKDTVGMFGENTWTLRAGRRVISVGGRVDRITAEVSREAFGDAPWRERLERIARDLLAHYAQHPWSLQIAMSRPPLGPGISDLYEHQLAAVDGIGLTDLQMDAVVTLIGGFVAGVAREARDAIRTRDLSGQSDTEWWEANAPILDRVMDGSRYPVSGRVGMAAGEEYQSTASPDHGFAFGLATLLDGVERLLERRAES